MIASNGSFYTMKKHQKIQTICDFSKVSDIAQALESMEN